MKNIQIPMKITKLHITDFQQFKDLELDFTYQSGSKKGQPLDKVCFIGQSGTGKTTLLELIISCYEEQIDNVTLKTSNNKNTQLRLFLYITAEIIGNEKAILAKKENGNFEINDAIQTKKENDKLDKFQEIEQQKILKISNGTSNLLWEYLMKNIAEYDEKIKLKGAELIQKGVFHQPEKMQQELIKWKEENPNPRENLAYKCLNPILNKFNLEVDIDNLQALVTVKHKYDNSQIPSSGLSTGGVVLNFSLWNRNPEI